MSTITTTESARINLRTSPEAKALIERAAFLATGLFLYLNGFRLNASQADATLTVLGLAAGDVNEEEFAAWIRAHAVKRN